MIDPFAKFGDWFAEAGATEPNDPNAFALATATPDGRPAVRIVLCKFWDASGFVFYTNLDSRKGQELAANPYVHMDFHWKSQRRQVRIDGRAALVPDAEAEVRFDGMDVPRPPRWSGWRVVPTRIEFWRDRDNRLHERLVYDRSEAGWTTGLLYP